MQRYDYVPDAFGVGLTVQIPKEDAPKNSGSTEDYRSITVSSVISKIFKHCLLNKYDCFLKSDPCQFFLKEKPV